MTRPYLFVCGHLDFFYAYIDAAHAAHVKDAFAIYLENVFAVHLEDEFAATHPFY